MFKYHIIHFRLVIVNVYIVQLPLSTLSHFNPTSNLFIASPDAKQPNHTMALFNGRVIAVTGAASGIGLATSHLLASRGASLSLADQNEAALGEVERDIRAKYSSVEVLSYVVDVRKEENVKKWIEVTMEKFGRLDGAANLAGVIGMFLPFPWT